MDAETLARFMARVHKTETCWLWTGSLAGGGYGRMFVRKGKTHSAHRLAYIHFHGEIPPGLVVMHSCDVKRCVSPYHLSVGTIQDNSADAARKGLYATGDRQGLRKHPERCSRGDKQRKATVDSRARAQKVLRENPHKRVRGEAHGNAKANWPIVREIRAAARVGTHWRVIAANYPFLKPITVFAIIAEYNWKPEFDPER